MRKILVYATIGIAALVVIFVGWSAIQSHLRQSAVRKVSDAFVANVLSGNANDSYATLTDSTQHGTSVEAWQSQVQKLSNFFAGASPTYQSFDATAGLMYVTYTVPGNDGNYKFSVVLTKQANDWRVQLFTSGLQV